MSTIKENPPKKLQKYFCEHCVFGTHNLKDFNRHLDTKKHLIIVSRMNCQKQDVCTELDDNNCYDNPSDPVKTYNTNKVCGQQEKLYESNQDENETNSYNSDYDTSEFAEKTQNAYTCKCGMSYKHAQSLSRHRRSCQIINQIAQNERDTHLISMVTAVIKEMMPSMMSEMNKMMMSCQSNQITNQTNNTNTNNNNNNTINNTQINDNKSFNLNLFLNETCKNAINLTDFIDEIVVTIADLERTGQIGYAGGISALFVDRLNELDQEDRPMHCGDVKRHTLFVRDNDIWEKEEKARQLLMKAIKELAKKSMSKIVDWKNSHPEHNDPDSKQNDQYNMIMMNSMSGGTKEESEANYEKIFNNVVKNVVIDKKRLKT